MFLHNAIIIKARVLLFPEKQTLVYLFNYP
jgi:hypothetical protein